MKTKFGFALLFILNFIISPLSAQNGFTVADDAENQLKKTIKEGKWIEFYDDFGKETSKNRAKYYRLAVYKAGEKIETVRDYFMNGKLMNETAYTHDKKNGLSKGYYESGKLKEEINYVDNEINGIKKIYFENGIISGEAPFIHNKIDGNVKEYYESGKLREEISYNYGQKVGINKTFYESGAISSEIPFALNSKNGTARWYFENGNLSSEIFYLNGQKSGLCKWYYEGGNLKRAITYVNDLTFKNDVTYNEDHFGSIPEGMLSPKDNGECKRTKWTRYNKRLIRDQKIEALDISSLGLTRKEFNKILDSVYKYYPDITTIDISLNELTDFPVKLKKFRNLKYILASENQIVSLNEDFAQCPLVKLIDLNNNSISSVNVNNGGSVFIDTNLTCLNLSGNLFTSLPNSLSRLKNLRALNLANNKIAIIPAIVKDLSKIRYLNLAGNKGLSSLPVQFFQLKTLVTLSLSGCNINSLENDAFTDLTNLKELDISNNKFFIQSATLKQLSHLTSINLSNTGLQLFPPGLFQLPLLEKLDISSNHILEIPGRISQLANLEYFYCNNSGLTEIPSVLFNIITLKEIKLNGNTITSVPKNSNEMLFLKSFELNGSPLKDPEVLNLRYSLPYSTISYFEPELNKNYTLEPLVESTFINTKALCKSCLEKNGADCLSLGSFWEHNGNFPLSVKAYNLVFANDRCSRNSIIAQLKVAEFFDDKSGNKPYFEMRRHRSYRDYDDYISNYEKSGLSMDLYEKVCNCNLQEDGTKDLRDNGCKKTYQFYSGLRKNLEDIYNKNLEEIKEHISSIATSKETSSLLQTAMSQSTSTAGTLISGLGSLTMSSAATIEESRMTKLKGQNEYLVTKIKYYKERSENYLKMTLSSSQDEVQKSTINTTNRTENITDNYTTQNAIIDQGGSSYNNGGATNDAVMQTLKRAEQGDALCQCVIAGCYAVGSGVPKDLNEALRWYQKAADQGYPLGQYSLALYYEYGGLGLPVDKQQALRLYRQAADQGFEQAKASLNRLEPGNSSYQKPGNNSVQEQPKNNSIQQQQQGNNPPKEEHKKVSAGKGLLISFVITIVFVGVVVILI